jgi:hypothetical protein
MQRRWCWSEVECWLGVNEKTYPAKPKIMSCCLLISGSASSEGVLRTIGYSGHSFTLFIYTPCIYANAFTPHIYANAFTPCIIPKHVISSLPPGAPEKNWDDGLEFNDKQLKNAVLASLPPGAPEKLG